jgi:uncharacterized protein (DUF362 family)
MKRELSRRLLLPSAGLAVTAGYTAMSKHDSVPVEALGDPRSVVAILRTSTYSQDLVRPMLDGIQACGLEVRGKRVLLKPNLVEFDRSTAINTEAAIVAAAYDAFCMLGAASVVIGEGPGHRRDTLDLARQAGYPSGLIDLNRDDVSGISGFAGEDTAYFPNTALSADLIVSLAKMKTHHWAGATLAMKNLFGLVPGAVYGWPKNRLHYIGITRSILELNRVFRNTFAIVDGIAGMEGNGPIQGRAKQAGVMVFGRDLRAVDATCCRLMAIDPLRVEYLRLASAVGHLEERWIEQRGEGVSQLVTEFELIPKFSSMRMARNV